MKATILRILIFLIAFWVTPSAQAQLTVTSGMTASQYVDVLIGNGISFSNAAFVGDPDAIGKFTTGTTNTNLGVSSGVLMTSGYAIPGPSSTLIGSSAFNFKSDDNSGGTDANLESLVPGDIINDATILEFDFIPVSDTIQFRYVFGSEEYPDYVCSDFNDVFGFFLTGPNPLGGFFINRNLALIPGTALPVAINTVNSGSPGSFYPASGCSSLAYSSYFVNNGSGATIVYNGFTTVLTAWAVVIPCETYHIKLAIGDRMDQSYDSGVFLEENSFYSPILSINESFPNNTAIGNFALEGGCNDASLCFSLSDPPATDTTIAFTLGGTATFGTDYTAIPSSVTILAGTDSACVTISPVEDFIPEGIETVSFIFTSQFNCISVIDSIEIEIHDYDYMTHVMSPDMQIACGQSTTISVAVSNGIVPYTYAWNNGLAATNTNTVTPMATTNYIVTITDFCGNQIIDSVKVTVDPGITDAGPDVTICEGSDTTLTAQNSQTYLWSTGETTQSISVSPTVTTLYHLTITNPCQAIDSVTVFVNPRPIIAAQVNPSPICSGEETSLSANGGISYFWDSNPNDASLTQTPGMPNDVLQVFPLSTTTYSVTGTDNNGCTNSASTLLSVSPSPVASFFVQPPFASSFNPTMHFYDNSQGSPVIWYWLLGDGTESNNSDFIHQFPVDSFGEYSVYLYVENAIGCSDSIVGSVYVKPDFTLYIPNAFSPNNDDINDRFHISGLNLPDKDFSFRVYNRWGQIVFVSSNPAFEWDGKNNGEPVPPGTYVYRMMFRDADNNIMLRQGNITLYY